MGKQSEVGVESRALSVIDAACCVLAIETKADPQRQLEQARATVAEWERVLRRLVAWNNNINGDGVELGEICQEAAAALSEPQA